MSEQTASEQESRQTQLPPYVAFTSVKSALQVFKDQGVIPNRIDRSVWGSKFSGTVTTHVLTALKFLGLINGAGVPQPALRRMVESLNSEQWGSVLQDVIRSAYAPIFQLNLETATSSEFNQKFKEAYGAEGETGRKCTTFFLNAAREASVSLSPYLTANAKPRSASSSPRKRAAKRQGTESARVNAADPPPPPSPAPPPPASDLTDKLLEKFPSFDPGWPDELKQSWFSGFNELMARTKKRGQ